MVLFLLELLKDSRQVSVNFVSGDAIIQLHILDHDLNDFVLEIMFYSLVEDDHDIEDSRFEGFFSVNIILFLNYSTQNVNRIDQVNGLLLLF